MPILFDDPFHERDMLAAIDKVSAKFKSYQDFFNTPLGEQKGLNIIETTTAFPGFGKTLATNIGMYVDNPTQSKAVQDLNEENSLSRVSEDLKHSIDEVESERRSLMALMGELNRKIISTTQDADCTYHERRLLHHILHNRDYTIEGAAASLGLREAEVRLILESLQKRGLTR